MKRFRIGAIYLMLISVGLFGVAWHSGLGHYIGGLVSEDSTRTTPKTFPKTKIFRPSIVTDKAPVLLVHGLNLSPDVMDQFAIELQKLGYPVVRLALTGHRNGFEEYKAARHADWVQDVNDGVEIARREFPTHGLVCFGYSLGGLLMAEAEAYEGAPCAKLILLAPAVTPTVPVWAFNVINFLMPESLKLPSAVPIEYRHNDWVTSGPNVALFESVKRVMASDMSRANVPTLVMIDPKDELVSAAKLREFSREKDLSHWRFEDVSTSGCERSREVHHLVMVREGVGASEWSRMLGLIKKFLEEPLAK